MGKSKKIVQVCLEYGVRPVLAKDSLCSNCHFYDPKGEKNLKYGESHPCDTCEPPYTSLAYVKEEAQEEAPSSKERGIVLMPKDEGSVCTSQVDFKSLLKQKAEEFGLLFRPELEKGSCDGCVRHDDCSSDRVIDEFCEVCLRSESPYIFANINPEADSSDKRVARQESVVRSCPECPFWDQNSFHFFGSCKKVKQSPVYSPDIHNSGCPEYGVRSDCPLERVKAGPKLTP